MKINNLEKIKLTWNKLFSNVRKTVCDNLFLVVMSLLQSQNCQLPQITHQMCKMNGNSFHANDVKLGRFLNSPAFKINDTIWRSVVKLVIQLLRERDYLKSAQLIPINVDFTTKKDEFLILFASIPFMGRAIPLYFSMRRYPQKKGTSDQKKQEKAFMKELKHLLPKGYTYVIVADRGFGNTRFIELCL